MSKEPRKLELSVTQVVASAAAAIAAAAASARLGVAGTFIGAGVVSIVATVSSAVVGHSLRRTNERVRTVVKTRAELVRENQALAERIPMLGRLQPPTPEPTVDGADGRNRGDGADGRNHADGANHGDELEQPSDGGDEPDRSLDTATTEDAGVGAPRSEPAAGAWDGLAARLASVYWKPAAAVCVLVFALAVLGITVIELAGGRTLHDLETGRPGKGTSISHVVNPGAPRRHHPPTPTPTGTPSRSPTPSPSGSASSAAASPSASVSGSPSGAPSGGPSGSPARRPSPSASGSPSKGPAPNG